MNKRPYFLISAFFLITAGCTKDYTIHPDGAKPLYVIDGRISNLKGPYYIRITKSDAGLGKGNADSSIWLDRAEAVKGAQVIISDDMGTTDTLKPVEIPGVWYEYRYQNGQLDSSLMPHFGPDLTADRGYYQTTRIAGMPGHTYRLQVRIGDEAFQASAYMPPVTALDSAVLRKDPAADPSGNLGDAAFAYFKEPRDEMNYYLLQAAALAEYPYDRPAMGMVVTNWSFPFYVTDDKTLPPYVNGMEVLAIFSNTGQSEGRGYQPVWVMPGQSVQVRLGSLTRETYEYFAAIEKQFQVDGNVYKPAPASAVGNISGGALGLFWATGISYKLILR